MPPSLSALNGTPLGRCSGLQAVDQTSASRRQRIEEAGLAISRSVARPQAVATGLPDSVPAW